MTRQTELTTAEAVAQAARFLDSMKGENILILDVARICNFTSYFVVATATSSPHLRALAARLERDMREQGVRPDNVAPGDGVSWIVLDFGDFVVHLFSGEARDYYRLEALWHDARTVPWTPMVQPAPVH
ncbi:MAG TPA: ribosome silencing factor [Candidatus Sumerlaeota bacterium]|nr:ribosome silencing factor [Candidatus Sumerlaeota bacterium]